MSVYALKQPHPNGGEWIQEHDSLESALSYQSHSGGILVRRGEVPGHVGLWWVEVRGDQQSGGLHPSCGQDCSGCCDEWEWK